MAREGNKIARGREFHSWSMSNNHPAFSSPFPLHIYTTLLLSTCLHQKYPSYLDNIRLKHLMGGVDTTWGFCPFFLTQVKNYIFRLTHVYFRGQKTYSFPPCLPFPILPRPQPVFPPWARFSDSYKSIGVDRTHLSILAELAGIIMRLLLMSLKCCEAWGGFPVIPEG